MYIEKRKEVIVVNMDENGCIQQLYPDEVIPEKVDILFKHKNFLPLNQPVAYYSNDFLCENVEVMRESGPNVLENVKRRDKLNKDNIAIVEVDLSFTSVLVNALNDNDSNNYTLELAVGEIIKLFKIQWKTKLRDCYLIIGNYECSDDFYFSVIDKEHINIFLWVFGDKIVPQYYYANGVIEQLCDKY